MRQELARLNHSVDSVPAPCRLPICTVCWSPANAGSPPRSDQRPTSMYGREQVGPNTPKPDNAKTVPSLFSTKSYYQHATTARAGAGLHLASAV